MIHKTINLLILIATIFSTNQLYAEKKYVKNIEANHERKIDLYAFIHSYLGSRIKTNLVDLSNQEKIKKHINLLSTYEKEDIYTMLDALRGDTDAMQDVGLMYDARTFLDGFSEIPEHIISFKIRNGLFELEAKHVFKGKLQNGVIVVPPSPEHKPTCFLNNKEIDANNISIKDKFKVVFPNGDGIISLKFNCKNLANILALAVCVCKNDGYTNSSKRIICKFFKVLVKEFNKCHNDATKGKIIHMLAFLKSYRHLDRICKNNKQLKSFVNEKICSQKFSMPYIYQQLVFIKNSLTFQETKKYITKLLTLPA